MKIGFWNVNGWCSANNNNDNSVFRETCTRALDLELICVAETHLFHDQTLDLQHYYFYGHNRNQLHVNARSGSGGVCLLLRKNLLEKFNVFVLDKSYDGILWVSFNDKISDYCFNICACYLLPHGSSIYVSAQEFYDQLLTNRYEFQHLGKFIICGDFNSRIGDTPDFIEGVDKIQETNVIDFTKICMEIFLNTFLFDSWL